LLDKKMAAEGYQFDTSRLPKSYNIFDRPADIGATVKRDRWREAIQASVEENMPTEDTAEAESITEPEEIAQPQVNSPVQAELPTQDK
jgi:hypothetical protein